MTRHHNFKSNRNISINSYFMIHSYKNVSLPGALVDYRTLRNIDLNLLIVLDVLLQERSVSLTAKKIGRTPSAVSHALSRLRDTFDDKILVRVGTTMEPTPRALKLQSDLKRLLSSLRRFMDDTDHFAPQDSTRTFALELPDNLSPMLSGLLMRFEHEAPNASLQITKRGGTPIVDQGRGVKIRILPQSSANPIGHTVSELGTCNWRTFARADHPIFESWSALEWLNCSHVLYLDPALETDGLEVYLSREQLKRSVKASVDSFAMGISMIEHSDCLLTCLSASDLPLSTSIHSAPVPFDVASVEYVLAWSETLDQDSAKIWFEGLVRSSFPSQ